MLKQKRNYRGRNHNRLKYPNTDKESTLAKSWKELNVENPSLIKDMLGEEPTEEQVELLSTMAQWLGSPVGFKFIDATIKKCLGIVK